jgi:hypothetical protein
MQAGLFHLMVLSLSEKKVSEKLTRFRSEK